MFEMNADLSNIDKFVGSVDGIITAIDSQQYKGNFLTAMIDGIQRKFMADSIANRNNIKHVFEWPDSAGGAVPLEPLFKLTREGRGDTRVVSYEFLPSHKFVPLPSARYGISQEILSKLSRHRFEMKALIMETMDVVTIAPHHNLLFIPDESNPRGYYMTRNPQQINPGGSSTGKFSEWFLTWMESRAPEYAKALAKKQEEVIASTGQRVIRDSAGRFATGTAKSFGYRAQSATEAEAAMMSAGKADSIYDV
jgi:hypothetical protein